jgi:hypothetical protein
MKIWNMEDKDEQIDAHYGHTDGEWGSKSRKRKKPTIITAYKLFDES